QGDRDHVRSVCRGLNHRDPFGLCEDLSRPECRAVWALGVDGSISVGRGVTLSTGVAWTGEGPAVWSQVGTTEGVGAGVSLDLARSPSLDRFRGQAESGCLSGGRPGGVGGPGCVSIAETAEGSRPGTVSAGMGVGTPEATVRHTTTRAFTWGDAKRSAYPFLHQLEQSIRAIGMPR